MELLRAASTVIAAMTVSASVGFVGAASAGNVAPPASHRRRGRPATKQQLADGLPDGPPEHRVVHEHQGEVQRQSRTAASEGECGPSTLASPTTTKGRRAVPVAAQFNQGCGDAPTEQTAPVSVRFAPAGQQHGLRKAPDDCWTRRASFSIRVLP
jgi:hypothetical protein